MKDEQSLFRKWVEIRIDLVQQIKLLNEGKYLHEVVHVDKADFVSVLRVILKTFESPSYF
jgi:methylenetetrahydrofolate reductase (NADPH)